MQKRVVIVGAGFGGLAAAKGLVGAPVDVTLIDRTNHHLFQPLLYQVATAALNPSDITWSLVHLMLLIDFRSRSSVYLAWSYAWFTRDRIARLLTRKSVPNFQTLSAQEKRI
jgi:NADH dehydrogenase FAD-containing subunit